MNSALSSAHPTPSSVLVPRESLTETQRAIGTPCVCLQRKQIPALELLAQAREPIKQVFIVSPDQRQKRLPLSLMSYSFFSFGPCKAYPAISSLEQVCELGRWGSLCPLHMRGYQTQQLVSGKNKTRASLSHFSEGERNDLKVTLKRLRKPRWESLKRKR